MLESISNVSAPSSVEPSSTITMLPPIGNSLSIVARTTGASLYSGTTIHVFGRSICLTPR